MKIVKIPMLAKYTNSSYQTFFKVVMDTALYNRFVNAPNAVLYTWGNYSRPSWTYDRVDTLVNDYLQANIASNNYQQFAVRSGVIPDADLQSELAMYETIFNKLGIISNKFFINEPNYNINTAQIKNLSGNRTFPDNSAIRYFFGNTTINTQTRTVTRVALSGGTVDENSSFVAEQSNGMYCNVQITILPEDYFIGGTINPAYDFSTLPVPRLTIYALYNVTQEKFGWVQLTKQGVNNSVFYLLFKGETADIDNLYPDYQDFDNPYSKEGNSDESGGDGTLEPSGLDSIQGASIPGLPTVSACDVGFITMYNPTGAQLKALSSFLWSDAFDIATYKKIFSDPMESIIGLSVIPVTPTTAGQKNVMFGTIDSGVSMSYLGSQWVQKDCGSVNIEKFVGCFMDADPYTKIQIFLPAIGFRQLSADDINGGTIHVVYNIDCLTGACAAFIEHSTRGVIYSYNGSMICNIPLTAINFSGAIQNAVSAVISGVGTIAGMTTGAAPITAMGAMGLLNSAANTALNSKPSVQRSGNMGGAAGIMGILTPYVIIERPKMSVPYDVEHYAGQSCNINMNLGNCNGFTVCEFVHVENTTATAEEVSEIEALLKEGVYL